MKRMRSATAAHQGPKAVHLTLVLPTRRHANQAVNRPKIVSQAWGGSVLTPGASIPAIGVVVIVLGDLFLG